MSLTRRSSLTHVALTVGDALRSHRIKAVLTGGACAGMYSGGAYVSVDADFVLMEDVDRARLDEAMASVGFERTGDRYVHATVPFYVEFPRGPLAIGGDEAIRPVVRKLAHKRALALSATDSCRDRLAAYYHWNDRQSLDVAIRIALRNRIQWSTVERWSTKENAHSRYLEFRERVIRERKKRGGGR